MAAMADVLSLRPSSTLTRAHRESKTVPGEIARCPRHSPSELLGVLGGPGRMKIDMIDHHSSAHVFSALAGVVS